MKTVMGFTMALATLVLPTAADVDVQGPVETVHARIKTCVPAKTVTQHR
jgi:hypothetical protein